MEDSLEDEAVGNGSGSSSNGGQGQEVPPMEAILDSRHLPLEDIVVDGSYSNMSQVKKDKPPLTVEELIEKVKKLEKAVEEVEPLKEENRKLKSRLKRAKQMFGNEWSRRRRQWKCMETELGNLKVEEGLLMELLRKEKEVLSLTNRIISLNLELARELSTVLTKKRKKECKAISLKLVKDIAPGGKEMVMMGRRDAVVILPEEVWTMILGNVIDPKDMWNLCNTCQLFDQILSKWKTGWLLEQALPYLYPHLPGNKLLECRSICKSWKGRVDSFLDNHTSLRPHDPDKSDARRLDFVNPMMEKNIGEDYMLSFSSFTNMTLFVDPVFLEKWKGTRLIGKHVCLILGMDYEEDSYVDEAKARDNENAAGGFPRMWTKFCEFLRSFGNEIWHLSVSYYFNDENGPGDSWEQNMVRFLTTSIFEVFPNLRNLRIRNRLYGLEDVIGPETIPLVPKLETFESNCWGAGVGTSMLQRYRVQLRRLTLSVRSWSEINQLVWPSLAELHISAVEDLDDFESLFGVGMRLPQLGKLGICLERMTVVDGPVLETICRVVRELSSTTRLTTLRLEGGCLWGSSLGEEVDESYDPAVSKIKTLEFGHKTGGFSAPDYAFLLRCFPLLENLNVFVRGEPADYLELSFALPEMCLETLDECKRVKHPPAPGKEEEIVEVSKFMYDGGMYKSNIWGMMPLLKVFTFQWDMYTRHGYEEYLRKTAKNSSCKQKLHPSSSQNILFLK